MDRYREARRDERDIFWQRAIAQMALDNAGNLLEPVASAVRGIGSTGGLDVRALLLFCSLLAMAGVWMSIRRR